MRRMATFRYHDYEIPEELAILTGAPGHTFDFVSGEQLANLQHFTPIESDHHLLEVGCGVGKLAIPIAKMLSPQGHYCGVDVIGGSIEWCQKNVTPRHPNAEFIHIDAASPMYNPAGTSNPTETKLPIADGSVDRIVLYSVFTHLFEPDIRNYFAEFRLLKPTGTVLATWLMIDDAALASVRSKPSVFATRFTFPYRISMGCYVNDINAPYGAVGYAMPCIAQMAADSGLYVASVRRGYWSGHYRDEGQGGQDTLVFRPI
jgi:SAM-dependent methyltransferase